MGTLMNIRLPEELLRKIDTYVDRLKVEVPGVAWNRSAAVRKLIHEALEEKECSAARSAKK